MVQVAAWSRKLYMGLGSERIITQVEHLLAGRLVIPSIQRGYVWQRHRCPFLLDSLYRGYPMGSLLVWNTNIEVPLKKAAVLQEEEVQLRPAVLLDGQQRLTSLAKVVAPDRVTGGDSTCGSTSTPSRSSTPARRTGIVPGWSQ